MRQALKNYPDKGLTKYDSRGSYPQIYRGDVEKTARSVSRSCHHE
jgi:hypothetical protein